MLKIKHGGIDYLGDFVESLEATSEESSKSAGVVININLSILKDKKPEFKTKTVANFFRFDIPFIIGIKNEPGVIYQGYFYLNEMGYTYRLGVELITLKLNYFTFDSFFADFKKKTFNSGKDAAQNCINQLNTEEKKAGRREWRLNWSVSRTLPSKPLEQNASPVATLHRLAGEYGIRMHVNSVENIITFYDENLKPDQTIQVGINLQMFTINGGGDVGYSRATFRFLNTTGQHGSKSVVYGSIADRKYRKGRTHCMTNELFPNKEMATSAARAALDKLNNNRKFASISFFIPMDFKAAELWRPFDVVASSPSVTLKALPTVWALKWNSRDGYVMTMKGEIPKETA